MHLFNRINRLGIVHSKLCHGINAQIWCDLYDIDGLNGHSLIRKFISFEYSHFEELASGLARPLAGGGREVSSVFWVVGCLTIFFLCSTPPDSKRCHRWSLLHLILFPGGFEQEVGIRIGCWCVYVSRPNGSFGSLHFTVTGSEGGVALAFSSAPTSNIVDCVLDIVLYFVKILLY